MSTEYALDVARVVVVVVVGLLSLVVTAVFVSILETSASLVVVGKAAALDKWARAPLQYPHGTQLTPHNPTTFSRR
jgi:uncharacterized protein YcnI